MCKKYRLWSVCTDVLAGLSLCWSRFKDILHCNSSESFKTHIVHESKEDCMMFVNLSGAARQAQHLSLLSEVCFLTDTQGQYDMFH